MQKLLLPALLVLILIGVGWNAIQLGKREVIPVGSVSVTSEYTATTTGEIAALDRNESDAFLLSPRFGVLGSVTILGTGTGELKIYDATTTDNDLRASIGTSSILQIHIPPSLAVGTYVFDALFTTGIVVEEIGAVPTSTILFR